MKQTGGSRFNRGESRQDAKFFFASVFSHLRNLEVPDAMPNILLPVHSLVGLSESNQAVLDTILESEDHLLLLDSGAFTVAHDHSKRMKIPLDEAFATSPSEIIGFNELKADYLAFLEEHADRLWGYIELDMGSKQDKRDTRAEIESHGFVPIPVFHPLVDGWEYLIELLEEYDRISVGNIVGLSHQMRIKLLFHMYRIWKEVNPDCWIHLLGMTPTTNAALSLPFSSYDSSTWTTAFRWRVQMNCLALGSVRSGMLPPYMHWPPGSDGSIVKKMSEYAILQYYAATRGNSHYLHDRDLALNV